MKKYVVAAIAIAALSGTSALAADMPVKAPAVRAATWTGCYLGANGGYSALHEDIALLGVGGAAQFGNAIGGVHGGCDYQTGNWVFGIQEMFDWTKLDNSTTLPPIIAGPTVTLSTKVSWLDTLTLRAGYLLQPQTLLYLKGGAAWARDKYFDTTVAFPFAFFATGASTRTGWTLGAGFERYFAPNWSFFIEYDFTDLGRRNEDLVFPDGTVSTFSIRQELQTVLFGVNYRFGGPLGISR
jgi:outer membrane immunogenic protein